MASSSSAQNQDVSRSSEIQYQENVHILPIDKAREYLAYVEAWKDWWPKQIALKEITSPTTVITYEGSELPILKDEITGIDYDYPRHLDDHVAFCARLSALVGNKEKLYFLYQLVDWFKKVGGTHDKVMFDSAYRRTIPWEILEDFKDVLVKNEKLSRYLTFILRHQEGKRILMHRGISMDEKGSIDLGLLIFKNPRSQLLNTLPHQWDPDFWAMLVMSDSKKRFHLKKQTDNLQTRFYISCVQGHSIPEVEASGEKMIDRDFMPVEYVVHATTREAWKKIRHEGLIPSAKLPRHTGRNPRVREDVHFATQLPENNACRIGGLRTNCPVWIFVSLYDLFNDRNQPRLTLNGYVVTNKQVAPKIFACALDIETKKDLISGWKADDKFLTMVEKSLAPPSIQEEVISRSELFLSAQVGPIHIQAPTDAEKMEDEMTKNKPRPMEVEEERPSTPASTSEVILFGEVSEVERERMILEEELKQTEEELAKADEIIKHLQGLDLSAPPLASSSSSLSADQFAPMDELPDRGSDEEIPPPPPSPKAGSPKLAAIPEEEGTLLPADLTRPVTPPKKRSSSAAAWLGDAPSKKPPPPEWQEPLVSERFEEYVRRTAAQRKAEAWLIPPAPTGPPPKRRAPSLHEEDDTSGESRSKAYNSEVTYRGPGLPPFKSPPPNAPPRRGDLSPKRVPQAPAIAAPPVHPKAVMETAAPVAQGSEEGPKRARSEAARPSFMVHGS